MEVKIQVKEECFGQVGQPYPLITYHMVQFCFFVLIPNSNEYILYMKKVCLSEMYKEVNLE